MNNTDHSFIEQKLLNVIISCRWPAVSECKNNSVSKWKKEIKWDNSFSRCLWTGWMQIASLPALHAYRYLFVCLCARVECITIANNFAHSFPLLLNNVSFPRIVNYVKWIILPCRFVCARIKSLIIVGAFVWLYGIDWSRVYTRNSVSK